LLTTNEYLETVSKALTSSKSSMKILENFDPLSSEHIKKSQIEGKTAIIQLVLCIRRSAFAVSKNNSH